MSRSSALRHMWLVVTAALSLATTAIANINLELRPSATAVNLGDPVAIGLFAVSDSSSNQSLTSAQVVFAWDESVLQLLGISNAGAAPSSYSGFPTDPYGLNESVPPADGDGMFVHIAVYGAPTVATPAGTLLTTFQFTSLAVSPGSVFAILPNGPDPAGQTIVYGLGFPVPPIVTGTLGSSTITVNPGPSATLTLTSASTNYPAGAQIDVFVELSATVPIVSGNFDLLFDPNVLQFVSADPNSTVWPIEVGESPGAGTLLYGVGGVPPGATTGTMARIRFNALSSVCNLANLVQFRPEPSQNLLIGAASEVLLVGAGLTVNSLGAITILGCDITAESSVCPYSTGHSASVPAQSGVTYAWTVGGSATLTAGQGTNAITFDTTAPGSATISVVVTLGACTCTDSVSIAVEDNELPVATCPANITQTADPGQCSALVSFTATATDNCPGVQVACTPPSGSSFPVGTTTVTCMATDASGNTATCSFTVTVADDEWPVALCPSNITQTADAGQCGAVVSFSATVSDNCPGAQVTCDPTSNSFFDVGVTTVTCTATDASGNTATCSFTVTVTDDEVPVALCPADITTTAAPGQCQAVVTFTSSVADNCPNATIVSSPDSGSAFVVGTRTVVCTATDASGNTATCSFTVTVTDDEAPVPMCPADITQTAPPGECGAVVTFSSSATDNCPNPTIACVPASGTLFNVGTTIVTCTATDASGNTATCSFTVTVTDDELPVALCPADITQTAAPGECGAVVTFSSSATDNCPNPTIACVPVSGTLFNVGTTIVTCTATDASGNTATCSFTVTVTDDELPVALCPADITQTADPGQCGATVSFAATATDNCPGVQITCSPASNSFFDVGTTTVTCTATDTSGNTATCSFTVTVTDDELPVALCPADITQTADVGQCGAVVTFSSSATDNCPGVQIACSPASNSFFDVGTTTVTCTATDTSGNTAMCSFTVTVTDDELPVAQCPADITETEDPGQGGAVVFFSGSALDNCPGAVLACAPPSGSFFPLGITEVTCEADDMSGNSAVCTFTVTILDAEATIQGQVRTGFDGAAFPGVAVTAESANVSDVTNSNGEYTLIIPAGTPETVSPCDDGWIFDPLERFYAAPEGTISGQDFVGRFVYDVDLLPIGDGYVGPGDLSYFATSWGETVPPGSPLHDFDCSALVDAGDLGFFASAWLKTVFDPTISLPSCQYCPTLTSRAPRVPAVDLVLVATLKRSPASSASAPPTSVTAVSVGQPYDIELWARDRSAGHAGLVGVFVDLVVSGAGAEFIAIDVDADFQLFAGGELARNRAENTGGATLTPGVGQTAWVRCATVTVLASGPGVAAVDVRPGRNGVAVFGQGLVPADSLTLSGVRVKQLSTSPSSDLAPDEQDSSIFNAGSLTGSTLH